MELTKEILEELGKPFPAKDIGLKQQSVFTDKTTGNPKALVVPFIDARDVIKRLNAVVGGEWYDTYRKGESGGLECTLTVCGVPRPDIGNDDNVTESEKSAYSDSLKRAAVKFNIGLFLYDMPKMYAELEEFGKTKKGEPMYRFARDEESRLRGEIARFLKEPNATAATARHQSNATAANQPKPDDKPKPSSEPKAEKSTDPTTNGNDAPKPVPTGRGGVCETHSEKTREYKKDDGTTFWGHRHDGEACMAEPKPETIVNIPGGK